MITSLDHSSAFEPCVMWDTLKSRRLANSRVRCKVIAEKGRSESPSALFFSSLLELVSNPLPPSDRAAVGNGLGQVGIGDSFFGVEVGQGAGDLEHAVHAAGRKGHVLGGAFE